MFDIAGQPDCEEIATPKMHFSTTTTFVALLAAAAFASPALAKKANYKINLDRYSSADCKEKIGKTQHLHNNHCKTFGDDQPAAFSYEYEFDRRWDYDSLASFADDDCHVSAYSDKHCTTPYWENEVEEDHEYDQQVYDTGASQGQWSCHKPKFSAGIRSISVTCNGNSPDGVDWSNGN
ncbi:hypothetical protein LTR36_009856 [Oleoguttula mirabilis]|uniref:Uncharacterized protein n=1 Tax=Oleoguttula mirabilis TaxID=1507867 RepID=A0AAV9J5I2_9PEZI|nr:hypothetical protein LTR36_009856 [Oleoguttula mirabilis]